MTLALALLVLLVGFALVFGVAAWAYTTSPAPHSPAPAFNWGHHS